MPLSRPGCHLHAVEKSEVIGTQGLLLGSFHHHYLPPDGTFSLHTATGAHRTHGQSFRERFNLEFNADSPVAGTGVRSWCIEQGFSTGPSLAASSSPAAERFTEVFALVFTHFPSCVVCHTFHQPCLTHTHRIW